MSTDASIYADWHADRYARAHPPEEPSCSVCDSVRGDSRFDVAARKWYRIELLRDEETDPWLCVKCYDARTARWKAEEAS